MQKVLRVAYTRLTADQYARLVEWLGKQAFTFEHEDDWVTVLDVNEAAMDEMELIIHG
jgi:hypothetical protein